MEIIEHKGDLLSVPQGVLVHGCNCQGVMGGGVAKLIRDRWPNVYEAYRKQMVASKLRLGDVNFVASASFFGTPVEKHVHVLTQQLPRGLIVANAMTQFEFGRDPQRVYVSYDALHAAMARVALVAREAGLDVHFPLIGCGLANGQWELAKPRIEAALGDVQGHLWTI